MNEQRIYKVLDAPHISEKVTNLGDSSNQYAFKVARDATKAEIKTAVERIFGVEVRRVTTANVRGKVKRNRFGAVRRRRNWKKAYVRVADGQELDYMVTE